jgi:hypothetical protein
MLQKNQIKLAAILAALTAGEVHASERPIIAPFLGVYEGGGAAIQNGTKQILSVRTELRHSPGTAEEVLVTTDMHIGKETSRTFDYRLVFTSKSEFKVMIGAQTVGGGGCKEQERDVLCQISIPPIQHSEQFLLAQATNDGMIPKRIEAAGTTTLNGQEVALEYELIGKWPGFSCRDPQELIELDIIDAGKTTNAWIKRLDVDDISDRELVSAGGWTNVTKTVTYNGRIRQINYKKENAVEAQITSQTQSGYFSGYLSEFFVKREFPGQDSLHIYNRPLKCVRIVAE